MLWKAENTPKTKAFKKAEKEKRKAEEALKKKQHLTDAEASVKEAENLEGYIYSYEYNHSHDRADDALIVANAYNKAYTHFLKADEESSAQDCLDKAIEFMEIVVEYYSDNEEYLTKYACLLEFDRQYEKAADYYILAAESAEEKQDGEFYFNRAIHALKSEISKLKK